ncbi:hypothetical protein FSP39_006338, partial [Pinctada imbricata]
HCVRLSKCKSSEYISVSSNGTAYCKTCSKCSPGYMVQRPCDESLDTICQPCAKASFSRRYNSKSCRQCRVCPDYSVQIRECTSTKNTKCIACMKDSYYSNETRSCRMCSVCPKGTYRGQKCSKTEDTYCVGCPPGTFSDQTNLFPSCPYCKHCRRYEEILEKCNSTQNNKCGDCKPGFFRLRSTLKCLRCSPCFFHVPGHRYEIVSECQEKLGNSENICMPTLDIPFFPDQDKRENISVQPTTSLLLVTSTYHAYSRTISYFTNLTSTLRVDQTDISTPSAKPISRDVATKRDKSNTKKPPLVNITVEELESSITRTLQHPAVLTGGVTVIILMLILGIVVCILVHVHRRRVISKLKDTTIENELTVNTNINSALLKTSNFVMELDDPRAIQRHFSQPNLHVDCTDEFNVVKRPYSWPYYTYHRRSFRDSFCLFLKSLIHPDVVTDSSISDEKIESTSNSSNHSQFSNNKTLQPSSSDSSYKIIVHRDDKAQNRYFRKSETEGIQNQDKTGTKANKQKPPPYKKKRTPDMGVKPGAQEE